MTTQQIAAQVSAFLNERARVADADRSPSAPPRVAAGFTVSSSFVKTMVPLRWLAVLSNCGFLAYGAAPSVVS